MKSSKRKTKAEAQQERDAKAQAKAARAEARQQSINRAAEFERIDIANEDGVDATPRPIFTPKQRLLSRNQLQVDSPFTTFTDTDIEESDGLHDETPPMPGSDGLVNADDSAVESDGPPTPVGKGKGKQMAPAARADMKNLQVELGNRKRRVDDVGDDVPPGSDEEQPQEPKPKRVKKKMREEINIATTKILEKEKEGNKYANMVKNSMGSSGKPASKVPSHSTSQAVGRQPQREGAIADIKNFVGGKNLYKEGAIADISYLDSSTRPHPDNNIR
jgi:hypothetical protein